jgi:hypothetical protein
VTRELVSVVTEALVDVASRGATITYGELLAELERREPELARSAADDLAPVLRAVSTQEDDAGRGLLTAVVVRGNSGLPGGGFFRLAAERGRPDGERQAVWSAELARVHRAHSPG